MAASDADDLSLSFWRAWPWWFVPALTGLVLVLYFVDPFIGDWDGMDYTMLSLAGYPSSMALGRNLFIFGNHALYEMAHALFSVQPEHAYLIFKYAVVAQAPLAVIAAWVLARDFSKSIHTATLAALFLVFSPVFVLYGGQVMTDVPSVLLLCIALIVHYRGLQQERVWLVLAGRGAAGIGHQSSRDDWVLCAMVGGCSVCLRLEIPPPADFHSSSFRSNLFSCAPPAGLHFGSSLTSTTARFGLAGANQCDRKRRGIRSRCITSGRISRIYLLGRR